jgi:N6-L-threonylcarbamoyladenine synthase
MISLGIEGTAHTFSVGIVKDTEVLANEKDIYKPPKGWGMDPSEVKKHHEQVKEEVLEKALKKANIELKDVGILSYSAGPGLPPCLKVTTEFAVSLSKKLDKPLVAVNHPIAHIEIGKLMTKAKDPIMLYVSGGNTQIIGYSNGRYRVFGETQDIPIGNAIDVFIRAAGKDFPGGPVMEQLAKNGKYIELPYVVKGMDLSFSGILTSAKQKLEKERLEDLCYSFQETCFSMLVEVSERALAHTEKKEMLLVGGVAANKRLAAMCEKMCEERGAKFYPVPLEYAGDCGANIAWTGLLQYKNGDKGEEKADFNSLWRTDEVEVFWI